MAIPLPGGELEYAVLSAVWGLGRPSARDVHTHVGEPAGLVYTTVAKVLDRLVEKGLLARQRHGRAFVYRAAIARERVEKARASQGVRRLLGDEPRPAIATLVDAVADVDPDLLDELARVVAQRRRSRRGA